MLSLVHPEVAQKTLFAIIREFSIDEKYLKEPSGANS